jgi:hypothetical protein
MRAIALAMVGATFSAMLALSGCQKVGTSLTCDGEAFKVDFGDKVATVTLPDKATASLAKLEQPSAAGTATVYTNGMMTFTRLEPPSGAAPVIKFARGRMAFQECTTAGG